MRRCWQGSAGQPIRCEAAATGRRSGGGAWLRFMNRRRPELSLIAVGIDICESVCESVCAPRSEWDCDH